MILTLDIGNADVSVCCVENGERLTRFQLSSDKSRTTDEYAALLYELRKEKGMTEELAKETGGKKSFFEKLFEK